MITVVEKHVIHNREITKEAETKPEVPIFQRCPFQRLHAIKQPRTRKSRAAQQDQSRCHNVTVDCENSKRGRLASRPVYDTAADYGFTVQYRAFKFAFFDAPSLAVNIASPGMRADGLRLLLECVEQLSQQVRLPYIVCVQEYNVLGTWISCSVSPVPRGGKATVRLMQHLNAFVTSREAIRESGGLIL